VRVAIGRRGNVFVTGLAPDVLCLKRAKSSGYAGRSTGRAKPPVSMMPKQGSGLQSKNHEAADRENEASAPTASDSPPVHAASSKWL
jgi:hypothetical protein